jgi:hypothetical protein
MTRVLIGMLLLSGTVAAEPTPAPSMVGFQTPTKNINCTWLKSVDEPPSMQCMVNQFDGKRPARPADCELDWSSEATLTPGQPATLWSCRGDTSWWAEAPVLKYGSEWKEGPFSCTVSQDGVRCTDGKHGFWVSRKKIKRLP